MEVGGKGRREGREGGKGRFEERRGRRRGGNGRGRGGKEIEAYFSLSYLSKKQDASGK